jgi:hypothetical protein
VNAADSRGANHMGDTVVAGREGGQEREVGRHCWMTSYVDATQVGEVGREKTSKRELGGKQGGRHEGVLEGGRVVA